VKEHLNADGDQTSATKKRVAVYLRCSSKESAKNDLSIPDQKDRIADFCAQRDFEIGGVFQDPGVSAWSGAWRAEFEEMVNIVLDEDRHFDAIIVYSFSRFFRDAVEAEIRLRALRKKGVELISITQDFGNDGAGDLARRMLMLFDEYSSSETSKHVTRTLEQTAKNGFAIGGIPPFGFAFQQVKDNGKSRNKFIVNESEALVVRMIYDLYLLGCGEGPLGIVNITDHLNKNGPTYRGGVWMVDYVHEVLRNTIYMGIRKHRGRKERDGKLRHGEKVIDIAVPAIVSEEMFNAVAAIRAARNPRVSPPRTVNGPTLLQGLAKCAKCGQALVITTGKSGQYRYYSCVGRLAKGKNHCPGVRIPMSTLDSIVCDDLIDNLLVPDRMGEILGEIVRRDAARKAKKVDGVREIKLKLEEALAAVSRLHSAIENGLVADSDVQFKERLRAATDKRDQLKVQLGRFENVESMPDVISSGAIDDFISIVRSKLAELSPVPARKACLRHILDHVDVDEGEVKIFGRQDVLHAAIASETLGTKVPSSVRGWRRGRDSLPMM
jgi:site-specific DNA recombinase